jgi:hypothetical protein
MNLPDSLHYVLGIIAHQPVLKRLFFASIEFVFVALLMLVVIRVGRIRSPRFRRCGY